MLNLGWSILGFIFVTAIMVVMFYRTRGITRYHVNIFMALLLIWTGMELFHANLAAALPLGIMQEKWIWPLILSLYQFTQVACRLPLGILSNKLKSRQKIIQLTALIFIMSLATAILAQMVLWSLIILVIGAGVVGSTYGLNSQYWSENWNIKRVYRSIAIMFAIPIIAKLIAYMVNNIFVFAQAPFNTQTFIYICLIALTIEVGILIAYSFLNERQATFALDLGVPNDLSVQNNSLKQAYLLGLNAFIVALFFAIFESGNIMTKYFHFTAQQFNFSTLLNSIGGILLGIFVATILLKKVTIYSVKLIALGLLAGGLALATVTIFNQQKNSLLWIIASFIVLCGFTMFQVAVFGATLHFDHKFPALILGIFLTIRSLALGSGQIIGAEVIVNIKSTFDAIKIILYVLYGILLIAVAIVFYSTKYYLKDLYAKIYQYEFKLATN